MNKTTSLTLGSLFDGIGGFPYAGKFFGIEPRWASEILPSAVSVTKRHLPEMAHVGDITKLDGGQLPPVDIITFGSPCQGLSYAGRRGGFADERSGLFSEAIRIIDEMREATNGRYPRYALWENVPGCTSSGKPAGSDFKAVLEAFTKTEIPFPRSGRWANTGMVRGRGVDLAWVCYDARRFGTAQRRRRIFLVVDFGGASAGEILFVPKSLRGYFEAGGTPRQGAAAYAEKRVGCPRRTTAGRNDVTSTICASNANRWSGNAGAYNGDHFVAEPVHRSNCLNPWDTQQSRVFIEGGQSPTLAGADGGGGRNPAGLVFTEHHKEDVVCLNDQGGKRMDVEKGDHAPTLRSATKGHLPVICRATALANAETLVDKSATLTCYHEQPIICKAVHQNQDGNVTTADTAYSLTTASNASARNAPLVACGFDLQQITSKQNRSTLKEVQPTLCAGGSPHVVLSGGGDMESPDSDEVYAIAATAIGRQPHNGGNGLGVNKEVSPTLTATDHHAVGGLVHPDVSSALMASGAGLSRPAGMANETDLCVAYCLQGSIVNRKEENGPEGIGVNENVSYTLNTRDQHGVAAVNEESNDSEACPVQRDSTHPKYIVRRLTPTECERLQGFEDGWTAFGHDGKPISDSKRYQMLGNSVAVPCVAYILMGMAEQLRKEV